MAPIDRPYTTFYWGLSLFFATVCELFDVEWYHDLAILVRGHSRSFKLVPFESLGAVFYLPFIVTMALYCIISETERKVPVGILPSRLVLKTRMVGLPNGEKIEDMYNRLDTIPAWDGQTDGQTSCHGIFRAMHTRRAVKQLQSSSVILLSCIFHRCYFVRHCRVLLFQPTHININIDNGAEEAIQSCSCYPPYVSMAGY